MRRLAIIALLPAMLIAQETVAPTVNERVGSVRGANAADYNIVQSWEFGYRFATIGGDRGKYQSDVNFGNGIRLLGSSLSINSKEGHGRWFDEFILSTQGLGNDPYESATVRLQKNRWYRYDLLWRQNDYRNPGLVIANGTHAQNTTHRWQDHDVVLFPQSHFKLRAGYSRVKQTGPALSSVLEFDTRGEVFPVLRDTYRQFDDYRVGGDVDFKGFRLTVQRRWSFYKEDTKDDRTTPVTGIAPAAITSFDRSQPYRGQTPGWMGNILGERGWIAVHGRFTYASTVGDFIENESAIGVDRFGAAQNRQILVRGRGNRPVTTGDFTVTLFPAARLTIINHTSASNTRMVGNNFYQQYDSATFTYSSLAFQTLSLRLVTNATDLRYRFSKKFDAFGGFRYSDRRIYSVENTQVTGTPWDGITAEQSNTTKAGVLGINWLPTKNLRLHAESEFGTNNNPFTPVSLRDYHSVRARARYRAKKFTLGAAYNDNYNANSIAITSYSSRARNYSGDASIAAKSWMSIDGSWSKLHLDTAGGINFFAGAPRTALVSDQSLYLSNLHAVNVGVRFALRKYADLYAAYSVTKDNGDGRSTLAPQATAAGQVFYNVQTFPMTFQSPLVRLSVRINDKVRWNAGWQYYGYDEKFGLIGFNQGYRAHTGYTSLLWAF
jgi:hypothetical protein